METKFMNTENLTCHKKLGLRSSNKHAALHNLSICYSWKKFEKTV